MALMLRRKCKVQSELYEEISSLSSKVCQVCLFQGNTKLPLTISVDPGCLGARMFRRSSLALIDSRMRKPETHGVGIGENTEAWLDLILCRELR
jgi:hypothetical protein